LSDAGTSFTTAGSPPPLDDAVEVDAVVGVEAAPALEDELLLLLLPHAAIARALSSASDPSSSFLQVSIRLLVRENSG
jgi:hypothetical protein